MFLPLAVRKRCSLTACHKEAKASFPLPLNGPSVGRVQLDLTALPQTVLPAAVSCDMLLHRAFRARHVRNHGICCEVRHGVTSGVSCETSLNKHVIPHLHREYLQTFANTSSTGHSPVQICRCTKAQRILGGRQTPNEDHVLFCLRGNFTLGQSEATGLKIIPGAT